jgi:ATP-dependent Clp protease adaptor protein ClpS
VFRSLEIKLDLKIVAPLVEMIRAQVAAIEARAEMAGQPDAPADAASRSVALLELQTLLDLFDSDFPKTATIAVGAGQTPAVLRACSYLRLGLRHGKLATVPDAALEKGLDLAAYTNEQRQDATCYLFLATLQTVLLEHEPKLDPARKPSRFERWLERVQTYFSPLRADHVEPPKWTADNDGVPTDQSWHVVVLNDPVNLMAYVTTAFQLVLGVRPETAHQRMREVHEAKQSIVFQGPREKAEVYARALRAWHLRAEAPAPAPVEG